MYDKLESKSNFQKNFQIITIKIHLKGIAYNKNLKNNFAKDYYFSGIINF